MFRREGAADPNPQFQARIFDELGQSSVGHLVDIELGTSYYVRGQWLTCERRWETIIATGNYDDLGGTVVGTSMADLAPGAGFFVDEIGVGNHDSNTGSGGAPILLMNVYEITYLAAPEAIHTPSIHGWGVVALGLLLAGAGVYGSARRAAVGEVSHRNGP